MSATFSLEPLTKPKESKENLLHIERLKAAKNETVKQLEQETEEFIKKQVENVNKDSWMFNKTNAS